MPNHSFPCLSCATWKLAQYSPSWGCREDGCYLGDAGNTTEGSGNAWYMPGDSCCFCYCFVDGPALNLQSAVMTSMSHHVWLHMLLTLPVSSSPLGVFPALDLAVTLHSFLFPGEHLVDARAPLQKKQHYGVQSQPQLFLVKVFRAFSGPETRVLTLALKTDTSEQGVRGHRPAF